MAADPVFTATPNYQCVDVSTANTARDGSGTIATGWTAGASGGIVNKVVLKATADPADSCVTMFLDDGGGNWDIFDEFDLGDPAAGSNTLPSYWVSRTFEDLVLGAGDLVGFAITVALTSGIIKAHTFGGNF